MLASTALGALAARSGPSTGELIARVKREVDVRKLVADQLVDERDFGRYVRAQCLSPDHPDSAPSALYFHDGATCTACGWRGDAIDIYRMFNPEASIREACEALLDGEFRLDGEVQTREARPAKALDPDQAVRFHLALAGQPQAVAGLERMGFTRPAIQHFRLGWAKVLVRLDPVKDEGKFDPTDRELVWKGDEPFQWQWRYSVPVFNNGRLVQVLYRRSDDRLGGGKITVESGCGAQLFNIDALYGAEMAVFSEGWGNVITLWQWGIAGVASTNGAGHFNDAWVEPLSNVRRLYVVGDADNAGSKLVQRFVKRLPWARVITLPYEHGTKKDIRDLQLDGWARADFIKLLRKADFEAAWRVAQKGGS